MTIETVYDEYDYDFVPLDDYFEGQLSVYTGIDYTNGQGADVDDVEDWDDEDYPYGEYYD